MPENDRSIDPELAVTRNDLRHVEQALQALTQTVGALDSKLDMMRETYLTTAEFGRWKKEDYQPHKDATEDKFKSQGERLSKWLGIVIGVVLTGSVTLAVYLIVNSVSAGGHP